MADLRDCVPRQGFRPGLSLNYSDETFEQDIMTAVRAIWRKEHVKNRCNSHHLAKKGESWRIGRIRSLQPLVAGECSANVHRSSIK